MADVEKVTVIAKDGNATVLTGKRHVELIDKSFSRFTTKRLGSFTKYLNDNKDVSGNVFVGELSADAFEGAVNRDTVPFAKFETSHTKFISILSRLGSGDPVSIESLESTLFSILEYGDVEVVKLYNFTRNCNIKALSEINRTVSDNGDFNVVYKREGQGDKTVRPVEKITFTVPILELHDETVSFAFKVSMDYKTDNGIRVSFKITNYQFSEEVERAVSEIIEKHLGEIVGREVYYGQKSVVVKDDSWKYKAL